MKELVQKLSERITNAETRNRTRTAEEYERFLYSIEVILKDIWLGIFIDSDYECRINKNVNWYSQNERYRDPKITARQHLAVFEGLLSLGLIHITKDGYLDRDKSKGELTKYQARNELLDMLSEIEGNPFVRIKPNIDAECIYLRHKVNGETKLTGYNDDVKINQMRDNLVKVNKCLIRHWCDIDILDTKYVELQKQLLVDDDKQPIDFSKRILHRIFVNGSFEQGGRFFRGWWQNVPKDYRRHISIDRKQTCEFDYSQLNPNMIYKLESKDIGETDAYDRVFEGNHRDIVKQAFNAMVQSETPLIQRPKDIKIEALDMSWKDLKQAIINAHKSIEHVFFKGKGNHLQFIDSNIAEGVMLQFVDKDIPILPIHDSFIMHHGYGYLGDLEEAMRRSYYDIFKSDIGINEEIYKEVKIDKPKSGGNIEWDNIEFDHILKADDDRSLWRDRNDEWDELKKEL